MGSNRSTIHYFDGAISHQDENKYRTTSSGDPDWRLSWRWRSPCSNKALDSNPGPCISRHIGLDLDVRHCRCQVDTTWKVHSCWLLPPWFTSLTKVPMVGLWGLSPAGFSHSSRLNGIDWLDILRVTLYNTVTANYTKEFSVSIGV